jgi:hypothetical protein
VNSILRSPFPPPTHDSSTAAIGGSRPHLVIAHPGHELLLHGWISRTKAVVHVLTDGSAHSSAPRLDDTAACLDAAGASVGLFGRLSDREAYAMIIERNVPLPLALVAELAAAFQRDQPPAIVVDAVEGYNPVHDLCRLLAGAARAAAGIDAPLYEYAVTRDPLLADSAFELELNDSEHAAKLDAARRRAAKLADVDELLARYGAEAFRREAFCRVDDWTAIDDQRTAPMYELLGEQRVAAGRYTRVIRRDDLVALRDALRTAAEERACAF